MKVAGALRARSSRPPLASAIDRAMARPMPCPLPLTFRDQTPQLADVTTDFSFRYDPAVEGGAEPWAVRSRGRVEV